LVLEAVYFGNQVSFSFEEDHVLGFEIDRFHHCLLHGLVVGWVNSFGVIQEVFFEKHAGDLSDIILGADNTIRQRAETQLNTQRTENPGTLLQLFIANMSSDKADVAQISCVLFKKYFLDNTEGVNPSDYESMQEAVMKSIDFKTQNMILLKRKRDLISKIYSLQNQNESFLKILVKWAGSEDIVSKQMAMYVFEKMT
jgi:hypothetical protein